MTCQLLIVDLTARSLLIVDGTNYAIRAEIPLPAHEAITSIHAAPDGRTVYLPAAGHAGRGALYVCEIPSRTLTRLPVSLVHPACFSLVGQLAWFADPAGRLYSLHLTTLTVREYPPALTDGRCTYLTAGAGRVTALWENDTAAAAAVLDGSGCTLSLTPLPGRPTALTAAGDNAYAACLGSDGVRLLCLDDGRSITLPLACPVCRQGLSAYPAALAADGSGLYVLAEESALTVIDTETLRPVSHAVLSCPLDDLQLLPGGRQALGHSLQKGYLALIDLVAGRIIAVTATDHRLGPAAVIPAAP